MKRNRDDPRSAAERDCIVERLIEDLRLQKCADVVVGNALSRGISGGQAKRVNIGISLVTRPRVLFLDEPTSGLDSKTSFDLMRVIRKFSDTDGVTVIATIHSPSSEAFRQFDRLVMLKAGRVTYAGPLFGEEGAEAYFYSLGHHCDPSENFADFLIATVADDAVDFANEFRASFHHKRNRDEVRKYVKEVVRRDRKRFGAPCGRSCGIERRAIIATRNSSARGARDSSSSPPSWPPCTPIKGRV